MIPTLDELFIEDMAVDWLITVSDAATRSDWDGWMWRSFRTKKAPHILGIETNLAMATYKWKL